MNTKQEVSLWQERISISKKYIENAAEEKGWNRFKKEYEGNYGLLLWKSVKAPAINEVFTYVQTTLSNLYVRDGYITVNPGKGGTVKGAAILEAWINYIWRELKIKNEIELEIIDSELVARAWHKVGLSVFSVGTEEALKFYSEKLYSKRVSWQDILWNVGALNPPYDCQWMAQRIIRPLSYIKKKWPQGKNVKGILHPYIDKKESSKVMYKDDIEVGILYEIWDAENKKVNLIAEGLEDKYLEESKDWPEYLDEFPFLPLVYHQVPDSPFPISPISPQEPQILEKIIILAQAVNHIKRWNRQAIIRGGVMSEKEKDLFEKGVDGAILEIAGADDIEKVVRFVDYGQLPTDFYLILDRLDQIRRSTSGQPEFDQGGTTKTPTRTLGELQLVRSGAKGRTDKKIDVLETHIENIARHLIAHGQANFDLEQVAKVVAETPLKIIEIFKENYDPISKQLVFKPEEIKGEYGAEVKAGSTLPKDKIGRMMILKEILGLVAAIAVKAGMSPFLRELISELLHDYDVKGLEEAFKEEQILFQQSLQAQAQKTNIEDAKTVAETEKRKAQADQIDAETAVTEQQLTLPDEIKQMIGMAGTENGMS